MLEKFVTYIEASLIEDRSFIVGKDFVFIMLLEEVVQNWNLVISCKQRHHLLGLNKKRVDLVTNNNLFNNVNILIHQSKIKQQIGPTY